MVSPDVALVQLINRTAAAYVQNAPQYITYTEHTHITAPSLGRSQDINRSVMVRQYDNFAVMQDLPQGAERTGEAFPIIPYFDPFTQFSFAWSANLKRVEISLDRSPVGGQWPIPALESPGVNVVVPYASFWAPAFFPDSTDTRLHIRIEPTSAYGHGLYPYEVLQDPASQLPAYVELHSTDDTETISFNYQMIQGHWMIVKGTFVSMEHFGPMTFQVIATTTYDNIAFPSAAPDPRLATAPSPSPTPQ